MKTIFKLINIELKDDVSIDKRNDATRCKDDRELEWSILCQWLAGLTLERVENGVKTRSLSDIQGMYMRKLK